MIALTCKCGRKLEVPESFVGQKGACPSCRTTLRLVAPAGVAGERDFQAALTVIAGPHHRGEVYLLGGSSPIAVGKLPDLPMILPGQKVSRRHARLIREGDAWSIEDTGSTNGTFVEDQRIEQRRALADGDFLTIGDYEFKYTLTGPLSHVEVADREEVSAARPAQTRQDTAREVGVATQVFDADTEGASSPMSPTVEDGDGLYGLAAVEFDQPAVKDLYEDGDDEEENEEAADIDGDGPTCPSCNRQLAPNGVICIDCGINVFTGRALVTTQETNLDTIYVAAERIIWGVSWLIWWCFIPVPIASEAFGTARPYALRTIAAITVLVSFWFFFAYDEATGRGPGHLMLWAGENYTAEELTARYIAEGWPPEVAEYYAEEYVASLGEDAEFHAYQLITHAFLHGGFFHLAGNLVYILVFGSRINALIGNVLTAVLYPVLAIGAALFQIAAHGDAPMSAMLGASGAAMGLAGMYLVLMPSPKVHLAMWFRWLFFLKLKIFSARGFWVVLFFIAFDVLYIALRWDDGVAHWAHFGGFLVGVFLAVGLLITRLVNARGGDIFTAIFGRYAWSLIGKPRGAGTPRVDAAAGARG